MSKLPARNRVIYQSEALFISPDTTGHHVFYDPKLTGLSADCIVKGKDNDGSDIYFDACNGDVSTEVDFFDGDIIKNMKNAALSSNFYTGSGGDNDPDPSLTGYHPVLIAAGFKEVDIAGSAASALEHLSSSDPITGSWGTAIQQLKRVQSANYSFTINRQDVNQFGQLGRIDSVVLEAPTVSLDFSYYLTDGENERLMGLNTDGSVQCMSGLMTRQQNDFGNNYFILTVPEGRDAVGGDQQTLDENQTVIGLGNGYVTDYSLEASVGSFPTASVTVEGLNIKSDKGTQWKSIPAVDPENGTNICKEQFFLPPAETGSGTTILKPGDITIDLKNSSLISKQISGTSIAYDEVDEGSAHVQSVSLTCPMGRTDLQRIGNTYSYAKELDFPVTSTLTVNALVADLKEGNLVDLLCGKEYDISLTIKNPQCIKCDPNDNHNAFTIDFKGALLDSESFSSSIGDNKSVDLTFTTQVGGPEQGNVGVFMSGFENSQGADLKYKVPPSVKIQEDEEGNPLHLTYYPYGQIGTTGGFAEGRY